MWAVVVAAVAACAAGGCGYSTRSRTARGVASIAVPFLENRTSEPGLEITFTESLVRYLIEDNTLDVTDEEFADAVLRGVIESFENRPFSFNPDLNAEEYHVIVRVRATLYNRREDAPIWENQVIVGDGSYFIDAPEGRATYDDAVEEAVREITEKILNMTVQDW